MQDNTTAVHFATQAYQGAFNQGINARIDRVGEKNTFRWSANNRTKEELSTIRINILADVNGNNLVKIIQNINIQSKCQHCG